MHRKCTDHISAYSKMKPAFYKTEIDIVLYWHCEVCSGLQIRYAMTTAPFLLYWMKQKFYIKILLPLGGGREGEVQSSASLQLRLGKPHPTASSSPFFPFPSCKQHQSWEWGSGLWERSCRKATVPGSAPKYSSILHPADPIMNVCWFGGGRGSSNS